MDVRGKVIEYVFQSAPPLRAETKACKAKGQCIIISIHTILVDGDSWCTQQYDGVDQFQPPQLIKLRLKDKGDVIMDATFTKQDWLEKVCATRFDRPMNYLIPLVTEHDMDRYLLSDYFIEHHTIEELEAMHQRMVKVVEERGRNIMESAGQVS